jgi:hypothetical protein
LVSEGRRFNSDSPTKSVSFNLKVWFEINGGVSRWRYYNLEKKKIFWFTQYYTSIKSYAHIFPY